MGNASPASNSRACRISDMSTNSPARTLAYKCAGRCGMPILCSGGAGVMAVSCICRAWISAGDAAGGTYGRLAVTGRAEAVVVGAFSE